MTYLKNGFKHFITICKHRSAVWYFGRRLGIGWQTFFHDLSKFHPTEFFESVKYYSGVRSPIDACKEINGYSKAWFHHRGRNRHHYEYWVDNLDNGNTPIDPPFKYKLEMLCDYLGASYTYSKGEITFQAEYDWWLNKISKPIAMHDNCKLFLTNAFEFMAKYFGHIKLKELDKISWSVIRDHLPKLYNQ